MHMSKKNPKDEKSFEVWPQIKQDAVERAVQLHHSHQKYGEQNVRRRVGQVHYL